MKFVALALALLLAVGSQAAPMMADAPSQLEHFKSFADTFLGQLKGSFTRAWDKAGDPQLKEYLSQNQNDFLEKVKTGEALVSTLAEPLAELNTYIQDKYQIWKSETKDQVSILEAILERHKDEYETLLKPVHQEMEQLKAKMQPVMEEVRNKMMANTEETRSALQPIVENAIGKFKEAIEAARTNPQFDEVKEQVRSIQAEDLIALREKIKPLAGELQATLQKVFEAVLETINKN